MRTGSPRSIDTTKYREARLSLNGPNLSTYYVETGLIPRGYPDFIIRTRLDYLSGFGYFSINMDNPSRPPCPPPRNRQSRLREEMRTMEPGDSFLLSWEEARCLLAHGHYVGWVMVQRKEGAAGIRVWRHS